MSRPVSEHAASGHAASGPAASGPAASGHATSGPAASGHAASGPAGSGPAGSGPAASGPAASAQAAAERPASGHAVFEYAVLRAVPSIERGECLNVGVVLYCQERDFLDAAVHVDGAKLHALAPDADVAQVRAAAEAVVRACRGEGPAGGTSPGRRFRWLTAPRSTVVQPGPVHPGLTDDPSGELRRLFDRLVR